MNGIFLHDSIFQWVGAYLMALMTDYLHGAGFFYLVVVAGFLATVFRGLKFHSYWGLAGYVATCSMIFVMFIETRSTIHPSQVSVVAINQGFDSQESGILDDLPREYQASIDIPVGFRAINQALDGAIVGMTGRVNKRFFRLPFEFVRMAAHMQAAEITDPDLSNLLHDFTDKCYRPALVRVHQKTFGIQGTDLEAMAWPGDPNLTRVYPAIRYSPSEVLAADLVGRRGIETCDDIWPIIERKLEDYVLKDPVHRKELARLNNNNTSIFKGSPSEKQRGYLKSLIRRRYTFGTHEIMDTGNQPSLMSNPNKNESLSGWLRNGVASLLGSIGYVFGAATMLSVAANVSAMGPYVQGMALMMVYAFFPFAVLFSLWPGNWHVLVKYFGVVLWIKSWTLGWAILSGFDTYQATLGSFDKAMSSFTGWTMYPVALCIAYVSVPVFCGMILSWATSSIGGLATGGGFAGAAGAGGMMVSRGGASYAGGMARAQRPDNRNDS
ncbi:conjugal transfer protein TraG N-terminal domain-containing protein [bacterium AH-315-F18]|nr:conjugal transfer protein TraG N-terminal domain-containing protein [bacterium AH-315-F18]